MDDNDFNGYNGIQENEPSKPEEIAPVKLGKKTVGIVLIALLLILLLVVCTIKGCSISKKGKSSATATNTQTSTNTTVKQPVAKPEEKPTNKSENVANNSGSSSATTNSNNSAVSNPTNGTSTPSTVNPNTQNSTQVTTPVQDNADTLVKVNENVVLGTQLNSTGIVSAKNTYMRGTSYLYEVSLVVVTGNGSNVICKYYCPRNTYDALAMGNSLKVTYQLDGNGNISINTISK